MSIARAILRAIFIYPLSLLYGMLTYTRNRLYDYGILPSKSFDVPVITVGNITVGGTGKTPHIELLAEALSKEFQVAVLSRGYKRKTRGFRWVEEDTRYWEAGDEPVQLKRKFPSLTVAVCANRKKGIETIMEKAAPVPDLILMDDGFQHRRVKPGLSILLSDYHRPMDADYRLPYGNLRESFHEKRRANILITTKVPPNLNPIDKRILLKKLNLFPYQELFYSGIRYLSPRPVFENDASVDVQKNGFSSLEKVFLITGLAKANPLFMYIRDQFTPEVDWRQFSDHYSFKKKDLEKIRKDFQSQSEGPKVIFTTEKDAVRLADHPDVNLIADLPLFFIPIEVAVMDQKKDELIQIIANYVRKNKRNSQLYKQSAKS